MQGTSPPVAFSGGSARNRTRRANSPTAQNSHDSSLIGINTELESFLNLNAAEAYRRPWHKLERGLRLNRIRKFVESEKERLQMSAIDAEALKNRLEKALDKKLLTSKSSVIYDMEKEEIQEIKGLVYHKTADGRMLSNLVDKKVGVTFRKKSSGSGGNTNETS